MPIGRFEEIQGWQIARDLTAKLYHVSGQGAFGGDRGLQSQLRRASVSIMANIAEGFDSQGNRSFLHFLGYALRSATEVQSHLYVALDQTYISRAQFDQLYARVVSVKSLICGLMRYLRTEQQKETRPSST
jgi:four helix bundle protein